MGTNEPSRQYTGQIKDGTGLYYYGARYYDPELGRFISPDSFLDGLNRYAYCRNNPVRYVDPSGNETDENGFFDEENFIAGMENLDALYENADWWNYADDIAEDGWVAINPPGKSGKTAPEVINPTKEEDRPIIEIPERDDGFIFDYVNDHCCPV